MFTNASGFSVTRFMKAFLARNEAYILTYHGILADDSKLFPLDYHMKSSEFCAQMEYLVRKRYRFLTLHELVDCLESGVMPRKAVSITFDDGFLNNYTEAFPTLRRLNIPATIFVATGYIGAGKLNWPELNLLLVQLCKADSLQIDGATWSVKDDSGKAIAYNELENFRKSLETESFQDYFDGYLQQARLSMDDLYSSEQYGDLQYMEWRHIEEIAASKLVEFGSHSVLHRRLNRLSIEDAQWEMQFSAEELRVHVGECEFFAYPYGDYSAIHEQMARELGYKAVVTATQAGVVRGASVYRLPRYLVVTKDLNGFDYFLRGGLGMLQVKSRGEIIRAVLSGKLSRPLEPRL